ncbi:MAG: RNA polymerase sigma factor [Candidatus Goldbacteria bacterium]|nr:RNA polymerase sigma factor [Candidatus Goldiibacteriota bacterium]
MPERVNIEELYKAYSRMVYTIAYRIVKNKADAEDITQDVFIKLIQIQDSLRRQNLKTFIYKITVNKSIDRLRNKKMQTVKNEDIKEELPKKKDSNENNIILNLLMEKIDIEQRIPILLSEIGGFSYKEISEILETNIGTIKSRINRGINTLKQMAKEEIDDDVSEN